MLIEEVIIEQIKPYPHLFDLSNKKYVDNREKNVDFQVIADEISSNFHTIKDGLEVPLQLSGTNLD